MTTSAYLSFVVLAIIFLFLLLAIGYATKRWTKNAEDFVLSGRETGTFVGATSMLAIIYAGTIFVLLPNFAMLFGFWGAAAWAICLTIGYIIYTLAMGSVARRCGATTLSEWMETRFDGRVRTITAIGGLLGMSGILANNIASFANSLSAYLGIQTWIAVLACFVVMLIFTYFSGMWAVNATNIFQGIMGVILIPLFVILVAYRTGGLAALEANWPGPGDWMTSGLTGNSLSTVSLRYPSVLTFSILLGFFLIWGSNYYYLRIASARNEKTAKRSMISASLVAVPLLMLPLCLAGSFIATLYPTTFKPIGTLAGTAAYGFMLANLGAFIGALMMVSTMAAAISTGSTALIGATSLGSRDIYQRNFNPDATPEKMLKPTRLIMLLIGIVTLILCFFPGGPTYLFAFANAWLGPPAVLLVLGVFWRKLTPTAAFYSVLAGMLVMAVLTVLDDITGIWRISQYMHVGIAGLIVTLGLALLLNPFCKSKYYGAPDWNADAKTGRREALKPEPEDVEILKLIASGIDQMVEIVDYSGRDSRFSSRCVERLDRGGYIQREKLSGAGFYSFSITETGKAALPAGTDTERRLEALRLTPFTLNYLERLIASQEEGIKWLTEQGKTAGQIIAINSALFRKGYVGEAGMLRRVYYATKKAKQTVGEFAQKAV
ncbi:sodium:solute symporter family protein [Papillibacter cinnamivorans]|uniref:Solute:Na+ symporter, SSS family n=1 Tax=Papillibacter cinnamivorans DSM 12816 TaxID=1122930 RepID=A0A1W2ACB5_9FIRM|nr:sodium:solute symporter family protein [Papillibacter cinnamivorans]SMC57888.1 solute:Na+ symporter, SSS family [Papillibacter cinnamivorans DSM 12816]